MNDENYNPAKSDFIMALRIIYREGLSDAFAHLSARSDDGHEMMFMPRKSPALVKPDELFFVDFEKPVPQSSLHQAIYKVRPDVKAVFHFHSPAVILLSVIGQTIRPMHNYSAIFYQGVPLYTGTGQVESPARAGEMARLLGDTKALMLRGHGAVVVGQSILESLHAGPFLGGVGAATNRSHETRHAAIHGARRSREDRQADFQAQLHRTGLGPFCGQMRRLNLSLPSSPVSCLARW
jgi:ribulose-5-phosphate 4-epimerase/fuculose-1-phosphate aldolase